MIQLECISFSVRLAHCVEFLFKVKGKGWACC
jgi:hypothetical protein